MPILRFARSLCYPVPMNVVKVNRDETPPIFHWGTAIPWAGEHFFIEVDTRKNSSCWRKHGHEGLAEFMIVEKGPMQHVINGCRQTEERRHIILVREQDVHEIVEGNVVFLNLFFPIRYFAALEMLWDAPGFFSPLLTRDMPPRVRLTEKQFARVRNMAHKLIVAKRGVVARQLFARFLHEIFTDYFASYLAWPRADDRPMPDWLRDTRDWIDSQMIHEVTLATVRRKAGRCSEHISRAFHKYLGMTLTDYINQRRLEQAAALLVRSDLSILEVALNVGFQNASHFYRLFQQHYDQTPLSYRRKHKSLQPQM